MENPFIPPEYIMGSLQSNHLGTSIDLFIRPTHKEDAFYGEPLLHSVMFVVFELQHRRARDLVGVVVVVVGVGVAKVCHKCYINSFFRCHAILTASAAAAVKHLQ